VEENLIGKHRRSRGGLTFLHKKGETGWREDPRSPWAGSIEIREHHQSTFGARGASKLLKDPSRWPISQKALPGTMKEPTRGQPRPGERRDIARAATRREQNIIPTVTLAGWKEDNEEIVPRKSSAGRSAAARNRKRGDQANLGGTIGIRGNSCSRYSCWGSLTGGDRKKAGMHFFDKRPVTETFRTELVKDKNDHSFHLANTEVRSR